MPWVVVEPGHHHTAYGHTLRLPRPHLCGSMGAGVGELASASHRRRVMVELCDFLILASAGTSAGKHGPGWQPQAQAQA